MNGPDHYRTAEELLASAAGEIDEIAQQERAAALVHATLALAAATAADRFTSSDPWNNKVVSTAGWGEIQRPNSTEQVPT